MSGLAPTTRLLRCDSGAQVALADVADAETAVPVWALDGDLQVVPTTIAALVRRTAKVHELRFASGRTAAVAGDHRLRTLEGWLPVDELRVAARVAVPRAVPDPADAVSWPDEEVVLLGHLLADPGLPGRRPLCYSTGEEANADAVEKAAVHFGVAPRRVCHGDWWRLYLPAPAGLPKGDRHPVLAWLDGLGVGGGVEPERVPLPSAVFALERRQLALFLRHLWAAAGSIRVGEGRQAVISCAAPSRAMADDLQAVLLRFGIASRVRAVGGESAWHVLVQGAEAQHRFIDEIGAHTAGGEAAQRVARFLAAGADGRDRQVSAPAGWDVLTSVRLLGEQPVCTATVAAPEGTALLAGGIAVAAG